VTLAFDAKPALSAAAVLGCHRGALPSKAETTGEIRMLRGSINHVSITVSDLDEAMKFFRPLLEFLGYDIGQVIQDLPYGGPDGWYAVYFLGPDRLKFEVVHMPAAEKTYTEAIRALERGTRR
jgi:hypothetical protein